MPFIDRKEQAELAEKAAKELAEAMLMEGMVDPEGLGLGGEIGGGGGGGGVEGAGLGVGGGGLRGGEGVGGGVSVDGSGSVGGTVASGLSGAAGGAGGEVPPSDPTKKRKKGKIMSDQMTVEEAAAKAALMFETDALAQVHSITSYAYPNSWLDMLLRLDM